MIDNTALILDAQSRYQKDTGKSYLDQDLYSFPQTWSDTSCGFGGMAGQMMTKAQTTVIIYDGFLAYVYFGGRFAYSVDLNKVDYRAFMECMGNHKMPGPRVKKPWIKEEGR